MTTTQTRSTSRPGTATTTIASRQSTTSTTISDKKYKPKWTLPQLSTRKIRQNPMPTNNKKEKQVDKNQPKITTKQEEPMVTQKQQQEPKLATMAIEQAVKETTGTTTTRRQ